SDFDSYVIDTRAARQSSPLFPYTTLFRSVWVIGAAVAQSMQRTGWPSSHTGVADGEVEQLPTLARDGAEFPLGALLSDRHLKDRSEEHTSELQSRENLVCRLLLEKKKEIQ